MEPGPATLDAQLLDLMLRAGSAWVLWLLLLLSLLGLSVALERAWFLWGLQAGPGRARVAAALAKLAGQGSAPPTAEQLGAARAELAGVASVEAAVAAAALERAEAGPEAVQEHVAAALERERLRAERGLVFLGTLGSNAPFVGLFGTVLGIVRAFHDLASAGTPASQGTQAVMAGIAEALVATGVGLLVALPAVAAYNTLSRRVEAELARAQATAHDILGHLRARRPEARG